jgi:hypothetical protein
MTPCASNCHTQKSAPDEICLKIGDIDAKLLAIV